MEIRTIFPSNLVRGEMDGNLSLFQVQDEEAKFVEQTIAAAKKEQAIQKLFQAWLFLVILLVGAILNSRLKRWDQQWAREAANWKAFKHFLDDFAKFKELPPESYKLWEHYLVFGILFGNAEKTLKKLEEAEAVAVAVLVRLLI